MKNRHFLRFFLGGLTVFAMALVVVNQSWAEEEDDNKVMMLESQMAKLVESQIKLTDTLQKALEPKDQFKNVEPEPQELGGDGTKIPPTWDCTVDYQEWPSSDTYKKSDWAIDEFALYPNNNYLFQDLNGDGLVDYFYHTRNTYNMDNLGGKGTIRSCVRLNNGRGWELAHKCYAHRPDNGVWTFYGDCAMTE